MIYRLPLSVLIMTYNEEKNIEQCLINTCNFFEQVIVVDSFSNDSTPNICQKYPVELYQHQFTGWAEQRNWILHNCKINYKIVLFLDADEYVNQDFIDELQSIIVNGIKFNAIYLDVKYYFLNTHLKFAYGHPKIRRIFKIDDSLLFRGEGAREYASVDGPYLVMKNPLIHDDKKPIAAWIEKHNKNAEREANLIISKLNNKENKSFSKISLPIKLKLKLWIRMHIWDELPYLVRPFLYFIYRYIFQLGFLDGKVGFIYCYLHGFWYQSLIDIKIIEYKEVNSHFKVKNR